MSHNLWPYKGLMMTVVVITLISVITIFISRKGWSQSAGAHGIVGLVTFILMFAQPIMAYFRPEKISSNRLYFNIGTDFNFYWIRYFYFVRSFLSGNFVHFFFSRTAIDNSDLIFAAKSTSKTRYKLRCKNQIWSIFHRSREKISKITALKIDQK